MHHWWAVADAKQNLFNSLSTLAYLVKKFLIFCNQASDFLLLGFRLLAEASAF